jgi:hypothetical protein
MKNDKLTGPVKDGLFTPINICHSKYHRQEYSELYSTLPIFDTSGIPVKYAEKVEAEGPVWQYRPKDGLNEINDIKWREFQTSWKKMNGNEYRQVYLLTVSPTEQNSNCTEKGIIKKADAQPVKEGDGGITPVNLGVANGIDPCPFCAGKEGETVFLGYKEPRYMISCANCNVRLIDDRKDKVQAKWNLRNGITFWDKQSWLKENTAALTTHSSSEGGGNQWISVEDSLPIDNQIVTAKHRHSGHIGKEVTFKNGKFYHEFTSVNSLETTDVEFKNVTEWQPI